MRKITPAMVGAVAAAMLAGTLKVPERSLSAYREFRDRFTKRLVSAAKLGAPIYPGARNGGQGRKSATRARRMNNAGHGNRWSRKHA